MPYKKKYKKVNPNTVKLARKVISSIKKRNKKSVWFLLNKILTIKKKYNAVFNKNFNFFYFINKIFNSITKNGKKSISINYFLKSLNVIITKNKFIKKKSFYILVYFTQIALKLLPCFLHVNLKIKGKDLLMPWLTKNIKLNRKKLIILGISWLKKSFKNRKEKTIFLKLFSEFESIRLGSSESINLKNSYYKNFYENKRYIRFLKRREWI